MNIRTGLRAEARTTNIRIKIKRTPMLAGADAQRRLEQGLKEYLQSLPSSACSLLQVCLHSCYAYYLDVKY